MVGQWTDESKKRIDTEKVYNDLKEPIGEPVVNKGLLRGLAKTFLGWSDKAPVGNGNLAEGARLFSPWDSIGSAFPGGIPDEAKLYGVYYSLNKPPEEGLPDKGDELLTLLNYIIELKAEVNQNSVLINSRISAEDTLLNTENASETPSGQDRRIIDYYTPTDDQEKTHEVVLEAEFEMNDKIAMLVYKNPIASNALRPILSRNYADHYKNDDFSTQSGEEAGYTYMDLVISLDKDLHLPDRLSLQFDAYSWRPLFVFDASHKKLNILNPENGTNLGNTSAAFSTLVSTSPSIRFDVDLSGATLTNASGDQEICLRVVLREGKNEKIPEKSITPLPGKSIAETLLQNMRLKHLSSEEIKTEHPSLTSEEIAKRTLYIPDDRAKALADTNGEETLKVTGYVEGYALSDAGSYSYSGFNFPLKSGVVVDHVPANSLQLGYQRHLGYFKETHIYNSYNQKRELIKSEKSESTQQGYPGALYWTAMQAINGFSLSSVSGSDGAVYASNGEKKSGAFVEGATLEVTYIYEKIIEEPTASSSTETTAQPTESEKHSETGENPPSEPSATGESSTSESRPGASEQTPRAERDTRETLTPEAAKDYVSIRIAETEEARISAQSANTEAKALPRTGEADLFLPFAALNLILGASLICYRKRKRITRH